MDEALNFGSKIYLKKKKNIRKQFINKYLLDNVKITSIQLIIP